MKEIIKLMRALFYLRRTKKFTGFIVLFMTLLSCNRSDKTFLVFVGTYTGNGSEGIYSFRFDPETGQAGPVKLAAVTENPSFLTIDPQQKILYAVNETDHFNGHPTGAVSTFDIDRNTGQLELLQQVSSLGAGPAHLSMDDTGEFLLVANYNGGNFAVFPVMPDGRLAEHTAFIQDEGSGPDPERQEGPHAHYIQTSPDNKLVLVADLGTDRVMIFNFGETSGSLSPNKIPYLKLDPGAGPRHFVFSASGDFLYVLNELASSVTAFGYDPSSEHFELRQTISTLPENFEGTNTAAEIQVDQKGRFLYVSNRGDNSIVQFSIDAGRGTLQMVDRVISGGITPRHFAIDPTGRWLLSANQNSGNIVFFRIGQEAGRLIPAPGSLRLDSPVCICFEKSSE